MICTKFDAWSLHKASKIQVRVPCKIKMQEIIKITKIIALESTYVPINLLFWWQICHLDDLAFCPRRSPERASKGKGKGWSVGTELQKVWFSKTESVFEELKMENPWTWFALFFECDVMLVGIWMYPSTIVIFSVMVIVMMSINLLVDKIWSESW